MLELFLVVLAVGAIGGVCIWRRQSPLDRTIHTVIGEPQDASAPVSLANLPQGSRLGAHGGRAAAILKDGTVLAESAGGARAFPSLAAYRDYVGDNKAMLFGDKPA
jgi:hypothetical protein